MQSSRQPTIHMLIGIWNVAYLAIRGSDRSSIENSRVGSDFCRDVLCKPFAQFRVNFLSLFRRCSLAGACSSRRQWIRQITSAFIVHIMRTFRYYKIKTATMLSQVNSLTNCPNGFVSNDNLAPLVRLDQIRVGLHLTEHLQQWFITRIISWVTAHPSYQCALSLWRFSKNEKTIMSVSATMKVIVISIQWTHSYHFLRFASLSLFQQLSDTRDYQEAILKGKGALLCKWTSFETHRLKRNNINVKCAENHLPKQEPLF